jgi:hypothetical protein
LNRTASSDCLGVRTACDDTSAETGAGDSKTSISADQLYDVEGWNKQETRGKVKRMQARKQGKGIAREKSRLH